MPLNIDPALPPLGNVVHRCAGSTMGTSWSVNVVVSPVTNISALAHCIEQELNLVVMQMSTWENNSDLSRFNRAAACSWETLPREFFDVLQTALEVAEESKGAFDPTAGPLVNLWGFGPVIRYQEDDFCVPAVDAIEAARRLCGWQRIRLDAASQKAYQPGGIYVDLSAIAKGFAVDRIANRLEQLGYTSYLVEIGGELRGSGIKPDAQPWWVMLEQPPGDNSDETVIALHGLSVATSGDYRRWHNADSGLRYAHTIDPRTGWPVNHGVASVTVLHKSCMLADAWSTALNVLGPGQGMHLAEAKRLPVLFVIRRNDGGFDEAMSEAFAALM